MPILEKFPKQPADEQDYDIDFTDYVTGMGEAVTDAHTIDEVSVDDDDLTIQSSSIHNGSTLDGVASCYIKVWTAGGTDGVTYKITARIATAGGRVHEVEIQVKVKED
jgi:hypothetical protein